MSELFKDITPTESQLQQPTPGGHFAVTGFRDVLYFAEIVRNEALERDCCRILSYDFERTDWDTHVSLEICAESDDAPTTVPTAVRFLELRQPGTAEESLFVRFTSPLGTRLLRLAPGSGCEPVAEPVRLIEDCFGFTRLADLDGRLFGLGLDKDGWPGRIAGYRPESSTWQPADLPAFPDGGKRAVSEISVFAGALYGATVDGDRGFELWRWDGTEAEPAWRPVVERGAWRYAHNQKVLAMLRHGDGLYLVLGTSKEARRPESKFLDYLGFEVMRVAADGTWDLLVGTPRFSPNGLVVPLSGLGAGIRPGLQLEFLAGLSHHSRLILSLQGVNGFHLWSSADGEAWTPLHHAEFAAVYRVDGCQPIRLGERVALVLETTDALGNQSTRIWAGCPGEAVED